MLDYAKLQKTLQNVTEAVGAEAERAHRAGHADETMHELAGMLTDVVVKCQDAEHTLGLARHLQWLHNR